MITPLPKSEEPTTKPGKLKLLLTPEAVAYALSVSRTTVYEMLQRGEMPSVKLGRARRIPLAWLETFIQDRIEYAA